MNVAEYMPLVHHLARKLFPLGPNDTRVRDAGGWDELISIGYLELVQAARRFDPQRGVKFITYATVGIRNRLIDHVRAGNQLIRVKRRKGQDFWEEIKKRPALLRTNCQSDEADMDLSDSKENPSRAAETNDQSDYIQARISQLPESWQIIILNHYFRGKGDSETARDLGVSRQAICQQRQRAEAQLRRALRPLLETL